MTTNSLARACALACAICMTNACNQGAPPIADGDSGNLGQPSATSSGADDSGWVKNGATACEKYLTPDLVGAIFKDPKGQNKKSDSQSCVFETAHKPDSDFSTITVYLQSGSPDTFGMDSMVKNGTPIQGVGDRAVRTMEDGVSADKGYRFCNIYVKPPFGNKLKGEAMAQKLGEVCNKLFALP